MGKPARPEERLHRDIAEYLTLTLGGSAWFTTFPAGDGGRLRGAILRGMGLKPGVPDVLIVDGGRAYWMEIKSPHGRVKPEQRQCHDALALARCPTAIVRSLDEVERALIRWGVPLKGAVVSQAHCSYSQPKQSTRKIGHAQNTAVDDRRHRWDDDRGVGLCRPTHAR